VSCVELYLQEAGTGVAQQRIILKSAALYGRLDILEWVHQWGFLCPYSGEMSTCVVKHGKLAALIWLKDHECPLTSEVCNNVARHRHLNILQWARANGCPWDKMTCSNAAQGGHLNILQWARANGCPWNQYT